jgi:hypothetical protein
MVTSWACNCIGPQNGEPKCPCMMRNVFKKNGRWVQAEIDLGPSFEKEEGTRD